LLETTRKPTWAAWTCETTSSEAPGAATTVRNPEPAGIRGSKPGARVALLDGDAPPPRTASGPDEVPVNRSTWSPPPRAERWSRLAEPAGPAGASAPRVLVAGGGITGAGIALDLALRGIDVVLVERGDWAGGTSSASSRLIHGGLRYLEQLELGLVRESCNERARLLRNAAGIVWPERFQFPLRRGGVGRLKLACGLALYTAVSLPHPLGLPRLIGRRALARRIPGIAPEGLRGAGIYLDGATDDARLTLAVVLSAMAAGATALSRCELLAAEHGARSRVTLRDVLAEREQELDVDALVLAGGPGVDALRARAGLAEGPRWVAPTRGTHVLVPRERLPTDGAVIFSSPVDGRVMFLIPWPRFTAIGTTDLEAPPDAEPRATRREVRYLLDSANGLVPGAALGEADVVGTWAGLRPLLASDADPSARSREERIEVDGRCLTIAGGKLTAYRAMAEHAARRVCALLGVPAERRSPTRAHLLRGAFAQPVARPAWSRLGPNGLPDLGDQPLRIAWHRRYAALAPAARSTCTHAPGGERPLDPETLLGEVDWAVAREDALLPSDVLLRRTDLGFGPDADAALGPLCARMAQVCGWSEDAYAAAERDARAALSRQRAWRDEPT
jgi:glycerol-3-phosphate dehydrogenase